MGTLEEFVNRINERLEKVENKTEDLGCRLDIVEQRVDRIEGKLDTLLDSNAEIKQMLSKNTDYSKSAKHNSLGWGFVSFVSSVVFNLAKWFF